MFNEITIDVESLRMDLLNDSYGAFFGGGFGGAMYESFEIERASPAQLVQIAKGRGVNLLLYEVMPEPEPEPINSNSVPSLDNLYSPYSSALYNSPSCSSSSSGGGSSSHSSGKKKKESRQERELRLQREREEQERRLEKERKLEEIRNRMPVEMQKLVDEIEAQYGCERQMKQLQQLRDQFREVDQTLKQEEAAIEAEFYTLEQFRYGYGDDPENFRMHSSKLCEKYRDMIEERTRLLASREQLSWTCFREKKHVRSRIKEIDKEISQRMKAISLRLPQIREIFRDHLQRLEAEETSFLETVALAQRNTKWKRAALYICMTKYPDKWELYQRDIVPILEYLHEVKRASIWTIQQHHPRKEDLSTSTITRYFRADGFRQLLTGEIIRGATNFTFDFSKIEEEKMKLLPWEKEYIKIQARK